MLSLCAPSTWQRAWESNPVAPFLTQAALAVRWLTVRLALYLLYLAPEQ